MRTQPLRPSVELPAGPRHVRGVRRREGGDGGEGERAGGGRGGRTRAGDKEGRELLLGVFEILLGVRALGVAELLTPSSSNSSTRRSRSSRSSISNSSTRSSSSNTTSPPLPLHPSPPSPCLAPPPGCSWPVALKVARGPLVARAPRSGKEGAAAATAAGAAAAAGREGGGAPSPSRLRPGPEARDPKTRRSSIQESGSEDLGFPEPRVQDGASTAMGPLLPPPSLPPSSLPPLVCVSRKRYPRPSSGKRYPRPSWV